MANSRARVDAGEPSTGTRIFMTYRLYALDWGSVSGCGIEFVTLRITVPLSESGVSRGTEPVGRWSAYPPRLSVNADIPARRSSAISGHQLLPNRNEYHGLPHVIWLVRCNCNASALR